MIDSTGKLLAASGMIHGPTLHYTIPLWFLTLPSTFDTLGNFRLIRRPYYMLWVNPRPNQSVKCGVWCPSGVIHSWLSAKMIGVLTVSSYFLLICILNWLSAFLLSVLICQRQHNIITKRGRPRIQTSSLISTRSTVLQYVANLEIPLKHYFICSEWTILWFFFCFSICLLKWNCLKFLSSSKHTMTSNL